MHAAVTAGDIQAKFEDANLDESLGGAPEDQDVQIPAPANRQDAHPEISAKIVRQVNFYFSDTNLPTDHFLLREVNKTSEGWVPVRLIAGFRKIKSLTKDLKVVVAALETSPELVVSGQRVRRRLPLPCVNEVEVLMRTVIVENLPHQATLDSLTEQFRLAGHVKMVRICHPNSGPRSTAQTIPGADIAFSRQQHALIEFGSTEDADTAVKTLTANSNWRSGLRVRPLLRQAFQPQQQQQNQARGYASRQQAQQRQAAVKTHETGKQQPSHASESQGQECGVQISEPDSGATSQPQATFRKQAQSGPQAPQMDRASVIDGAQPIEPTAQAQQGTGTQPKVGEASTKSQTSKKTKKDYAAWAGATAETRAIARAHLKGNPDMADNIQPMLAGQTSAPGSCQPKMPDGSRGFSMGRGRGLNAVAL